MPIRHFHYIRLLITPLPPRRTLPSAAAIRHEMPLLMLIIAGVFMLRCLATGADAASMLPILPPLITLYYFALY